LPERTLHRPRRLDFRSGDEERRDPVDEFASDRAESR
jgi:hypothetical protein